MSEREKEPTVMVALSLAQARALAHASAMGIGAPSRWSEQGDLDHARAARVLLLKATARVEGELLAQAQGQEPE